MDDSNQMSLALDLILKTIIKMNPPEFGTSETKNWQAISNLIPGSSPSQVERRYNQLQLQSWSAVNDLNQTSVLRPGVPLAPAAPVKVVRAESDTSVAEKNNARALTNNKLRPSSSDVSVSKSTSKVTNTADNGPTMVIHVCDEAKNLKQDFQCPRDLLIREMKYFAEYLSTDAQRWEEVDISVHCDVLIFDWLMRFVKRGTRESPEPPKLEAANVVSILISSDFLKMDTLVSKCIEYCHGNMNAILATPCNMNCINDTLVNRIAALFNHNELDDVKDRKDKFKSKLFAIKAEHLFHSETQNPDSPENGTTLFRCSMCKSLLTKNTVSKIRCIQSRMTIDARGKLVYSHVLDSSWDINEHILNLKADLKTWRDVYWRLWGTINYLDCSRCGQTFFCREFTHCRYHSEPARFLMKESDGSPSLEGIYPCCGCKTLRFDPSEPIDGCRTRDHVVQLPSRDQPTANQEAINAKYKVYEDLLLHKDAICVTFVNQFLFEEPELDVFANEEFACGLRDTGIGLTYRKERNRILQQKHRGKSPLKFSAKTEVENLKVTSQPRLQPLMIEKEIYNEDDPGEGESDDEVGDDEPARFRRPKPRSTKVTVDPQAILMDGPDFGTVKKHKWDGSKTVRWNQDAQREEDHRRMTEIVNYLVKLRLNPNKWEKLKQKEYAGGLFSKLEAQWKATAAASAKPNSLTKIGARPRVGQRASIS